jgi:hypothetical protein
LYVQKVHYLFYFSSSCPQVGERSESSRGHDGRPTTDRVSARNGRRGAGSKPVTCRFSRTAG